MKIITVIYWSGTGNTKMMADAIVEGAKEGETIVEIFDVNDVKIEKVLNSDVVAIGCPSMGDEVLEESEMEPFIETLEKENIKDKPFALFGSYDWGDGQWMREWEERMKNAGVKLVAEGLIVQNTPEDDELEQCKALGRTLAQS
ncbi:flavodoxin short chain [Natranaerovirga hydrolytica]|uniref:Flavodoxin n=1 Tax=Natranaerovirga hydrolytica TaxID=680378 RepID=A0A4R1MJ65_9FIRM|nr:flavodoxin [Natranaerovirga hydrolytica]TCK92808.1 flavodoxin short chain [Natranaerovirga hydrolytica]